MTKSRNFPLNSDGREFAKYTMSVTVTMTGVAAHRIRRFEEYGLCNPARTGSNQRLFSDYDIELIREISDLENDGINLAGIKTIMLIKHSKGNPRFR